MNLAMMVTLSRIMLAPLFLLALFLYDAMVALVIVLLSGITDILDGYLARKEGHTSWLGGFLDGLADKVFMVCVIIGFSLYFGISVFQAVLFLIRDFIVGLLNVLNLFIKADWSLVPVSYWGKATTGLQYLTVVVLLIGSAWWDTLIYLVFLIGLIAGIDYSVKFYHAVAQ